MGGSVARRHNYSERPRRLSATSPRLAACMVSAICSSGPSRSFVKASSCLLHPLNNAGVKRQNCSDCLIQLLRAAEQLDAIYSSCAPTCFAVVKSNCVDPVNCKYDPTNFPQSFLLPIAEMGGSVARRHIYSERPRRLSATSASPRLACMHGICDLQQLAQPQFCERLLMFTAPSE